MIDDRPFWEHLPVNRREELRALRDSKEYREIVKDLTSHPMAVVLAAENGYLAAENRMFADRLSEHNTRLLPFAPDNYRILYVAAQNLSPFFKARLTLMKFDTLNRAAALYAKNPPPQQINQLPLETEQKIIDIAIANLYWGAPHIAATMHNLGFSDVTAYQVASTLRRNNIPTTDHRHDKGIPWDQMIVCIEKMVSMVTIASGKCYPPPAPDLPPNPYRRQFRKLVQFFRNATIPEDLMRFNRYLRLENMILTGMIYNRQSGVRLTVEEKRKLAAPAAKLCGRHKTRISLLTTDELIRYSKKLVSRKHTSVLPRFKSRPPEKITDEALTEMIKLTHKDYRYETREQIFERIKKHYGRRVSSKRIYDILLKIDFFRERPKANVLPWRVFKSRFADVTWAGDFFSVEVLTEYGILTYQVMFFVHLGTGKVVIAGASHSITSQWIENQIRQWTDNQSPLGPDARFLIHDCDRRYTHQVDWFFTAIGIRPKRITPEAPVMNCQAENFVSKIKTECLNQLLIISEGGLKTVLQLYTRYYNTQRPNALANGGCIIEDETHNRTEGEIRSESLMPGLLNYYYRAEESVCA